MKLSQGQKKLVNVVQNHNTLTPYLLGAEMAAIRHSGGVVAGEAMRGSSLACVDFCSFLHFAQGMRPSYLHMELGFVVASKLVSKIITDDMTMVTRFHTTRGKLKREQKVK